LAEIKENIKMGYVGEFYPDWLAKQLINDSFDWTKAIKTNFITFFDNVTLHDSYWITLNLNNYGEITLVIKLDAFWNKDFSQMQENNCSWPFLLIRIPKAVNVSFNSVDQDMIISESESKSIPDSELEKLIGSLSNTDILPKEFCERLIACKEVHKTKFIDLSGANIEILHDAEIEILLLEQKGNYIDTNLDHIKSFVEALSPKNEKKGFIKGIWDKFAGE
jgi:hypothetical protein